tara:strand:- start:3078 stop:3407 length:330 start_codon:yes stop_codon:yes gene_type:complete
MTIYNLVKDDTAPQVRSAITRSDTGAAVDLTGATVRMYFRSKGSTTILFTLTASDVGDNFSTGVAVFNFSLGNLDQSEGFYEGEIEITHADSTVETIYDVLDFYLRSDF